MKFLMIFLFFCTPILLSLCLEKVAQASAGPCDCAVFDSMEVHLQTKPIIQQNPMNVTCDANGNETCLQLCAALAQAARARGPILLCAALIHADMLTVYVYAKICNATSWTFSNVSSPEPICCHDGEPVTCKNSQ